MVLQADTAQDKPALYWLDTEITAVLLILMKKTFSPEFTVDIFYAAR